MSLNGIKATAAIPLLAACLVTGCGGGADGRETVPVAGTIRLQGQPLQVAMLTFVNPQTGAVASAPVEQGSFQVELEPGEYRVAVQPPAADLLDENGRAIKPAAMPKIPPQYLSEQASGLSVRVDRSATAPIELELQ